MRRVLLSVLLVGAAPFSGCDGWSLVSARRAERAGRLLDAIAAYERFALARPRDPRAAEALVRAGELYAGPLRRCLEARRSFESAARAFPKLEPWASRAKAGLMSCPDFFPLGSGKTWVYGDSASRGRNMRLEWEVVSAREGAATVQSALYAGTKRLRAEQRLYEMSEWTVWEIEGRTRKPILRYPYVAGQSWTLGSGRQALRYTIESDDARAKTAAGLFEGCLKVREQSAALPGAWKYDYYAPFVGRVLTTVGGRGFENPNTELISFR